MENTEVGNDLTEGSSADAESTSAATTSTRARRQTARRRTQKKATPPSASPTDVQSEAPPEPVAPDVSVPEPQASDTSAEPGEDSSPSPEVRRTRGRRSRTTSRRPRQREEVSAPAPEETSDEESAGVAEPQEMAAVAVPVQETPEAESPAEVAPEPMPKPETKRPRQTKQTSRRQAVQKAGEQPKRARVAIRRGLPEIVIGDETVLPVVLFGNVTATGAAKRVQSQVRRAAARQVRLFSTLVELVCPPPPDGSVYRALDERVEALLAGDPHAYVIPRIVFVPGNQWREQYPMEMQAYERGGGEDPSIASDHFWAEAGRSLRTLIEHANRTSYGHRIVGYHLERGEWFQPADAGFDRSFANREGFRRWLRRKYRDSEVALRAAWYDGDVHFYTAAIPSAPSPGPGMALFDPRREARWIDFMEYTSDITVERIMDLARVVKEATGGSALVSVCYGYTWEFSHPWSGHLALKKLLECPDVDILTGPVSYTERPPGSSGALPAPVDSVILHGKLWLTEDDTKTHLAKPVSVADPYNPRMESRSATEAVHLRTIGTALSHQLGIAWMDLWGEGWLDTDEVWEPLGWYTQTTSRMMKVRRRTSPEVVALLDESSLCLFNGGEALMQRVLQGHRESLYRAGASVGFYLQSDLLHRDFPIDAKLYLFLTPYRLPVELQEAIRERLMGSGKVLVWFYAPGAYTSRTSLEEATPEVVGLNLRPQPWNSEIGTRIVERGHPITQPLADGALGVRMRLNPSFYVDDDRPGIAVLGEYEHTGRPSLVLREFEGTFSVFCGEPVLTPEFLRGLCRFAGVQTYTRAPEDYSHCGYGWLSVHVLKDGQRTLSIPEKRILCDVAEGCVSAPDAREYRIPVKARTTRLFYIGEPDTARKLGFDTKRVRVAAPPPLLPPPPPLPFYEPAQSSEVAETDGSLMDALAGQLEQGEAVMDEVALAELLEETEPVLPREPSSSRRRRRRGGRSRSRHRKPTGGAVSSTDGAGVPESFPSE